MSGKKILFFVYLLICIILVISTPSDTWSPPEGLRGGSILWGIMFIIGIILAGYAFNTTKEDPKKKDNIKTD